MSNSFMVNKSGSSIPIYSDTSKSKQIGTLYNREAFGYNRNWGGDDYFCNIVFRNAAGNVVGGFLVDPPNGVMTQCTDYSYGTATINGTKYKTFIMRSSQTVYTASGSVWGTVSANRRVACITALSGDSHPHWKAINYVENASGQWVKVTGGGTNYGFVDAGLSVASGYSSIPFYGSW